MLENEDISNTLLSQKSGEQQHLGVKYQESSEMEKNKQGKECKIVPTTSEDSEKAEEKTTGSEDSRSKAALLLQWLYTIHTACIKIDEWCTNLDPAFPSSFYSNITSNIEKVEELVSNAHKSVQAVSNPSNAGTLSDFSIMNDATYDLLGQNNTCNIQDYDESNQKLLATIRTLAASTKLPDSLDTYSNFSNISNLESLTNKFGSNSSEAQLNQCIYSILKEDDNNTKNNIYNDNNSMLNLVPNFSGSSLGNFSKLDHNWSPYMDGLDSNNIVSNDMGELITAFQNVSKGSNNSPLYASGTNLSLSTIDDDSNLVNNKQNKKETTSRYKKRKISSDSTISNSSNFWHSTDSLCTEPEVKKRTGKRDNDGNVKIYDVKDYRYLLNLPHYEKPDMLNPEDLKSEVAGVYWDKRSWIASWYEGKKRYYKSFSAKMNGFFHAKYRAIEVRLQKVKALAQNAKPTQNTPELCDAESVHSSLIQALLNIPDQQPNSTQLDLQVKSLLDSGVKSNTDKTENTQALADSIAAINATENNNNPQHSKLSQTNDSPNDESQTLLRTLVPSTE